MPPTKRPRSPPVQHPPAQAPVASPGRAHTASGGERQDARWVVPEELHAKALDGVVRALAAAPWSEARRLVETGKIRVHGEVVTQCQRKVRRGDVIELSVRAPSPRIARVRELEGDLIAYLDGSVVVVRKPAGMSTVPFGDEDPGERDETLEGLLREVLARRDRSRGRAPLGVVQRLDKQTSGLLVFARSFAAKKHLAAQLRRHSMRRRYLALAHGVVRAARIESHITPDRGDGFRGSVPAGGHREGQLAVTHIEPLEALRGATLVACRLETGRTHQIRIHLSEAGHPVLGEKVYIRSFRGTPIPAPRLMLHATELGFDHPQDDRPMLFTEPPPADFEETLARLR